MSSGSTSALALQLEAAIRVPPDLTPSLEPNGEVGSGAHDGHGAERGAAAELESYFESIRAAAEPGLLALAFAHATCRADASARVPPRAP